MRGDRAGRGLRHSSSGPSGGVRGSAHGTLALQGDTDAPTCGDCHQRHAELEQTSPASPIYPRNVPELCARCHMAGETAARRIERIGPDIVQGYEMSIHRERTARERPRGHGNLYRLPRSAHGAAGLRSRLEDQPEDRLQRAASVTTESKSSSERACTGPTTATSRTAEVSTPSRPARIAIPRTRSAARIAATSACS